jgi:hypothetical protein
MSWGDPGKPGTDTPADLEQARPNGQTAIPVGQTPVALPSGLVDLFGAALEHPDDMDISSAFARLEGLPKESVRADLRMALANHLLSEGIARIAEVLPHLADVKERQLFLSTAIPAAYQKDPRDLAGRLAKLLGGEMLDNAFYDLARAQCDAGAYAAAIETLGLMRPDGQRINVVATIADKLGAADFHWALAWLQTLPAGKERETGGSFLLNALSTSTDYKQQEELLPLVHNPTERKLLAERIGFLIDMQAPASLDAFVASLPAGEAADVQAQIAIRKIVTNGQPLAQRIEQAGAMEDPQIRAEAIAACLQQETDLDSAAAIVCALPANLREAALPPLGTQWTRRNAEDAARWVEGLPDPALKDSAAEICADILRHRNRPAALKIAALIANDAVRQRVENSIHRLAWTPFLGRTRSNASARSGV